MLYSTLADTLCSNHTGYQGVAAFNTTNTTYSIPSNDDGLRFRRFLKFLPAVVKGIQCLGSEKKLGKCLMKTATSILPTKFLGYPPGFPFRVPNVAWVSCSGTENDTKFGFYIVAVVASVIMKSACNFTK